MIRGRGQQLMAGRSARVIDVIRQRGVVTPQMIKAETGLSASYISDILCQLLRQGQVARERAGYRTLAG